MARRKFRSGGSTSATALDRTKKYKYNDAGTLAEFSGDEGAEDIVFSGSKSNLRRMADLERNVSILAAKIFTTDGSATDGNDTNFKHKYKDAVRFKNNTRFDGTVDINDNVDLTGNLVTSGSTTHGGGYGSTGATINASGDISMDGNIIVDGTSSFSGGYGSSGVGITDAGEINADGTITSDTGFAGNLTGNVTGNVNGIIGASSPAAGSFTTIGASSTITGALTGNVTGDVTGDLTGDSAGTHTGAVVGNVTGNVSGNLTSTGTSTMATVDINGGAIDGSTIGATTASTGAFSTLTASGGYTGAVTGNVTGNVTGDVTGDLTGDSAGTHTGAVVGDVTGNVTGNVDGILGGGTPAAATVTTLTASSNVTVQGNLTVTGTSTSVNSNTVNIGDNTIVLNSDETGAPSQDGGFEIERGTSANVSFLWDETNDQWTTGTESISSGSLLPASDEAYDLGSSSLKWRDLHLSGSTINLGGASISASGANLAIGGGGDLDANSSTASRWKTSRTLELTGAVTGSVSFNGGSNVTVATTATSDPTLTLDGDVSGSATFTDLGDATLTVTVADDSHNHVVGNIDGLAEFISDTAGAMWSSNTESGVSVTYDDADNTLDIDVNDPTITLTGAVTGSATMTNLGNVSITTTATADPTITLAGDLSGSATLTNLGNATLTATIGANSVALGTDTTGNYVGTGATAGNGLSGSASGEGSTFTVTSNATTAASANTIAYRDGSGNINSVGLNAGAGAILTSNYVGRDANDYIAWSNDSHTVAVVAGTERLRVNTSGIDVSGSIVADGDITAYSDVRLKEDIKPIEDALHKVKALSGNTYMMHDRDGNALGQTTGLIAQEVMAVLPEAIKEDEEGFLSVKYGNLMGLMVEAMKQLDAQNAKLQAELDSIGKRVSDNNERVVSMQADMAEMNDKEAFDALNEKKAVAKAAGEGDENGDIKE